MALASAGVNYGAPGSSVSNTTCTASHPMGAVEAHIIICTLQLLDQQWPASTRPSVVTARRQPASSPALRTPSHGCVT